MNLNRQLLAWISGLAVAGAVLAVVLVLTQMREAAREEMRGSQALAELLIVAAQAVAEPDGPALAALESQMRAGQVRHLVVRWSDAPADQAEPGEALSPGLARWLGPWLLGPPPQRVSEHRIRIGERELVLRPAPDSELTEVVGDAGRLLGAMGLAALLMLAGVWWLVRSALAPAQALCDGLERLQAGADQAGFPALALREYRRIGAGIDELARRLSAARAAQHRLNQRLIALQEHERQTIARDLHDEMGQHLSAMSATLAVLNRHVDRLDAAAVRRATADLQQGLRSVTQQLRSMLARLRPIGLDAGTLPQEAQQLVDTWRATRPDVAVDFQVDATLPAWPTDTVLALYRALQEALTNIRRHSPATEVQVRLQALPDGGAELVVQDNGRGPQASAPGTASPHVLPPQAGSGLLGMSERVAMVGGELRVDERPGGGWRVQVRVPSQATE